MYPSLLFMNSPWIFHDPSWILQDPAGTSHDDLSNTWWPVVEGFRRCSFFESFCFSSRIEIIKTSLLSISSFRSLVFLPCWQSLLLSRGREEEEKKTLAPSVILSVAHALPFLSNGWHWLTGDAKTWNRQIKVQSSKLFWLLLCHFWSVSGLVKRILASPIPSDWSRIFVLHPNSNFSYDFIWSEIREFKGEITIKTSVMTCRFSIDTRFAAW